MFHFQLDNLSYFLSKIQMFIIVSSVGFSLGKISPSDEDIDEENLYTFVHLYIYLSIYREM